MGLRERVAELNIIGDRSRVETVLGMLDDDDRIFLEEMLNTQIRKGKYKYPARAVALALSSLGSEFEVGERTIQRYRQDNRESV